MKNDTINKTYLGELVTGLVIVAKSMPHEVIDSNCNELAPFLLQTAHDLADELELGREVNWDVEGAPTDGYVIDGITIVRLLGLARSLTSAVEDLPQIKGDYDVN